MGKVPAGDVQNGLPGTSGGTRFGREGSAVEPVFSAGEHLLVHQPPLWIIQGQSKGMVGGESMVCVADNGREVDVVAWAVDPSLRVDECIDPTLALHTTYVKQRVTELRRTETQDGKLTFSVYLNIAGFAGGLQQCPTGLVCFRPHQ